ncbi:MAG TPA: DUF3822 family protein [Mucilaginibacter sp.]|jgi:hypothetical protein
MGDHNNNFQDSSFTLYKAYSYTLLLQLEAASFNYAVAHNNQLLAWAQNCSLNELTGHGQLTDLLSATYKKVIVGLPATGLTLVPKELFKEDRVADIARFLDVNDHEKVFAQSLDNQNVIIYKTDESLVSAIEKFGLKNTVYTAKGWITAISKNKPSDDKLYVEVGKDTVQFLYYSLDELRFYNTFEFKNEDELSYFAAFVTQQLELNPKVVKLVLSGDVEIGDKRMKRLAEFFPDIELNTIKMLELPEQIAAHKILALAALSLCGSSEEI